MSDKNALRGVFAVAWRSLPRARARFFFLEWPVSALYAHRACLSQGAGHERRCGECAFRCKVYGAGPGRWPGGSLSTEPVSGAGVGLADGAGALRHLDRQAAALLAGTAAGFERDGAAAAAG